MSLVLANDPDADRLAAAERQPSGEWHVFSGNEIGVLLGVWQWEEWRRTHPSEDPSKAVRGEKRHISGRASYKEKLCSWFHVRPMLVVFCSCLELHNMKSVEMHSHEWTNSFAEKKKYIADVRSIEVFTSLHYFFVS